MVWGIIGALDAEVKLLVDEMQVDKTTETYGCKFIEGKLRGQDVVVVCCGVGTINATLCASVIIREFGAQCVINVGVAGNACPDLGVLDLAVADELVFHDKDNEILKNYYPHCILFPTDDKLRTLAVNTLEHWEGRDFRYKVGRIATGDLYVTNSADKANIVERTHPLCVEMEGASIAQVAYMNRIPCLVIRSMSDNADEDAEISFDTMLERAAHHSATLLLGMLQAYKA